MQELYDIAIVGAGPAGLYAAHQAAWLNLRSVLIDENIRHIKRLSRIRFADELFNVPGYYGKSGKELLMDMERVLDNFGSYVDRLYSIRAVDLTKEDSCYRMVVENAKNRERTQITSKTVILATGVEDTQPEIHSHPRLKPIQPIFPYANKGIVYYCEICDGQKTDGKTVGVMGHTSHTTGLAVHLVENFGAKVRAILTHGKQLFQDDKTDEERRNKIVRKLEE